MKKTLTLVAALGLCACGGTAKNPAAPPPPSPVAAQPPAPAVDPEIARLRELAQDRSYAKTYPQADAVIALDKDDVTLGKDGSVTHHHKSIVKLLDAQRGKEKFADVHIPFDQKRETLKIDLARTVNADGVVKAASPAEIGDIVPPRLEGATTYSDVRERVVSFPAVDKGSVVELEYTRTSAPSLDSAQGGDVLLATWDPILSRVVTITVPQGTTPKLSVEGTTLAPAEFSDQSAGTHSYLFSAENLPDRHEESGSPDEEAVLPRLVYGFEADWQAVLAKVSDRFLDAAVPQALPATVKAQADKLVAGAKTDSDKARAIYRFVAHDIRSVGLPLGWAGYEPNPPDEVLANRYGDDRDKVGLLLALCAAEKIEGQPVLARTGKVPVIAAVPTVAQFDRVIARLSIGGKEVWLDPSDENGQFGIAHAGQDNLVLVLSRGGGELAPRALLDPSTSVSRIVEAYSLDARGRLDAKFRFEATGWFAGRAMQTLRPLKGDHLTQFFQSEASQVSPGAIDAGHEVGDLMSVEGPLRISQHVSVPEYAPAQGNYRVVELPGATLGFLVDLPPVGLSQRKYPLWVGPPRTISVDTSVTVPGGWKVAYVPPDLKGQTDGLSYTSTCKTRGRTINCHGELQLNRMLIPPDKYEGFHEALGKLAAYDQRIVVLSR